MFKGHADQKDLAALVETTDKHSNRLNCRRNVCFELSGNTRPQRRLGLVTHGNQSEPSSHYLPSTGGMKADL